MAMDKKTTASAKEYCVIINLIVIFLVSQLCVRLLLPFWWRTKSGYRAVSGGMTFFTKKTRDKNEHQMSINSRWLIMT